MAAAWQGRIKPWPNESDSSREFQVQTKERARETPWENPFWRKYRRLQLPVHTLDKNMFCRPAKFKVLKVAESDGMATCQPVYSALSKVPEIDVILFFLWARWKKTVTADRKLSSAAKRDKTLANSHKKKISR